MTAARGLIVYLSAVATLSASVGAAARESGPGSLAERIAPLVRNFMSARTDGTAVIVPALSLSIGRNGTLLYADGFGEARPRQPATARTIYMTGSLTKQFTASAVLRVIEQGARLKGSQERLSIATPVSHVLNVADAWAIDGGPPIRIKNLLSMTSNLPNFTRRPPRQLDPWGAVPAQRLLGEMKDYRPSGYPGSFEYSNTSYFLLSEVLEAVEVGGASRGYRQILKDEVFDRLGLADTGFESEPAIAARLAEPHYQRRPRFAQPDWLKGSGDVASSVIDLFRWDKALIEGHALSDEMRAAMLSDAARVDVWTYYGMGWFITHRDGVDRYFHSGTVSGYTSFNLIVRPAGSRWISVSLLTNSDGVEGLDDLAEAIATIALE